MPDVRPEMTAISVDPTPATVALLAPGTRMLDEAELAHRLLAEHPGPFFEAIRRR